MNGYGGRAGAFQFDDRVIDGVKSEEVYARILEREADEKDS